MIENMLGILAQKAQVLNKKVEYLTIKSLRGKISRYLLEQHKISGMLTFNIPLGRNELAELLALHLKKSENKNFVTPGPLQIFGGMTRKNF